jgi:hypothetical protein
MPVIAAVLALNPECSAQEAAEELARHSCRYSFEHARRVVDEPMLTCYAVDACNVPAQVVPIESPSQTTGFLIGDFPSSPPHNPACTHDPIDDAGAWFTFAYDPARASLDITGDAMGTAWLYLAQTKDAWFLASDFGALVKARPVTPQIDEDALLSLMALGYIPDQKTLFKGITMLPPGATVRLDRHGIRTLRTRTLPYGDRYASLSRDQKFTVLDGLFETVTDRWFSAADGLVLSLSSGLDSRYGLGLLRKRGCRARYATFGHPRSADARGARSLSHSLGLDSHVFFAPPDENWTSWERSISALGGIGGFQWLGWSEPWFEALKRLGTHVALGLYGDTLSGKHLVQDGDSNQWFSNWEKSELRDGWIDVPLLRPGVSEQMRSVVRAGWNSTAVGTTFAFPHQQALHFDFYCRQRRSSAAQVNMASRFLRPIPFFHDPALLEFWTNLPFEDLRGQSLYRAYARSRFPDVFPDEPRPALFRRAVGTIANLGASVSPSLKAFVTPPEINRHRRYRRHGTAVVDLLNTTLPQIDHLVDARATASAVHRPELNILQKSRVINLCMLLRLARN